MADERKKFVIEVETQADAAKVVALQTELKKIADIRGPKAGETPFDAVSVALSKIAERGPSAARAVDTVTTSVQQLAAAQAAPAERSRDVVEKELENAEKRFRALQLEQQRLAEARALLAPEAGPPKGALDIAGGITIAAGAVASIAAYAEKVGQARKEWRLLNEEQDRALGAFVKGNAGAGVQEIIASVQSLTKDMEILGRTTQEALNPRIEEGVLAAAKAGWDEVGARAAKELGLGDQTAAGKAQAVQDRIIDANTRSLDALVKAADLGDREIEIARLVADGRTKEADTLRESLAVEQARARLAAANLPGGDTVRRLDEQIVQQADIKRQAAEKADQKAYDQRLRQFGAQKEVSDLELNREDRKAGARAREVAHEEAIRGIRERAKAANRSSGEEEEAATKAFQSRESVIAQQYEDSDRSRLAALQERVDEQDQILAGEDAEAQKKRANAAFEKEAARIRREMDGPNQERALQLLAEINAKKKQAIETKELAKAEEARAEAARKANAEFNRGFDAEKGGLDRTPQQIAEEQQAAARDRQAERRVEGRRINDLERDPAFQRLSPSERDARRRQARNDIRTRRAGGDPEAQRADPNNIDFSGLPEQQPQGEIQPNFGAATGAAKELAASVQAASNDIAGTLTNAAGALSTVGPAVAALQAQIDGMKATLSSIANAS